MSRTKITKENCLLDNYPEIAAQWHPEKNEELTPGMVRFKSVLNVWWRCGEGHEWTAKVSARVAGMGCPVCLNMKVFVRGKNDLKTLCPRIAEEWHPDKNGELHPEEISPYCNKRVWWRCREGHEWETIVEARVRQNSRCPYCMGKYMIKGINDLKTLYPELASEWDYGANEKEPEEYKPTSPAKVSWVCNKGHHWIAKIEKRTARNQGCPYCSGRVAIPGENDFATLCPELMVYWDHEKNTSLGINADEIKPHSDRRIWCKCEKGHSWEVQVKKLVRGDRCPYCGNHKIISGENDFATLAPQELLDEWDYEKNRTVKPNEIALHYGKKVWWCCSKGHEWRGTPDGRLRAGVIIRCPYCAGIYPVKGETDLKTKMPEIVDEYSPRNRRNPEEIHWGTSKKVWWKCRACGNEWRCPVHTRTKGGNGCPRCHGRGGDA